MLQPLHANVKALTPALAAKRLLVLLPMFAPNLRKRFLEKMLCD
jgi:hypothetical protein